MNVIILNTLQDQMDFFRDHHGLPVAPEHVVHLNHPEFLKMKQEGVGSEKIKSLMKDAITIDPNVKNVLICTCSSIGGLTEEIGEELGLQVARIDRFMAAKVVAQHEVFDLAYTTESTWVPSTKLFRDEATKFGKEVVIKGINCTAAWPYLTMDKQQYLKIIGETIDEEFSGSEATVLAQASMNGCQKFIVKNHLPIYNSVTDGLTAIKEEFF